VSSADLAAIAKLLRGEPHRLPGAALGERITVHLPVRAFPARENEVLCRHAVADARRGLEEAGVSAADVARRTARIEAALREHERAGAAPGTLVALEREGEVRVFSLAAELPYAVAVRRSFVLRPLLRVLQKEGSYRVLAVSANHVALYQGDARGLVAVPHTDLPASLQDALGTEKTEKQLRVRGTAAGGGAPLYYAHDAASEERKIDLRRFHHGLATAVNTYLQDDPTPLVLAADVTHQGGLRSELRVPGLVAEPLVASPDHWSVSELHERAWPLVVASRASRDDASAALEAARRRGPVADRLDDVVAAAAAARIRRLWLDAERIVPGRIDPTRGGLQAGERDDDVLEELAALAIRQGAEVRVVSTSELRSESGAVAELR
jgi:hypothetical protein